MGLILSIFVAAVGVVELLAFYDRVLDNVRLANTPSKQELDSIHSYYVKNLHAEERRRFSSPCLSEVGPRKRSLSPYPSLGFNAPRNSICKDNPSISVCEIEEEVSSDTSSKASSPEPETRKFQGQSAFLISPNRKSKSRSKSRSPDGRSSCSTSRSISPLPFRESNQLAEVALRRKRASSEQLVDRLEVNVGGVQKSSSSSEIVEGSYWKRSPSPFQKLLQEEVEASKNDSNYMKYENRNKTRINVQREASSSSTRDSKKLKQAENTDETDMEKKPEPFWVK